MMLVEAQRWRDAIHQQGLKQKNKLKAQYRRKYSNLFQSEVWEEVHLKGNEMDKGKDKLTSLAP